MQTPQTLTSKISKRPLLNYLLYLPPEYDPQSSKRWPLILFLHGFGERGDTLSDLERVKMHGVSRVLENGTDLPFIVVSPQCSRQSDQGNQNLKDLSLLRHCAAFQRNGVPLLLFRE